MSKKRLCTFFILVLFLWQNTFAVAQSQSSVEKRADQAFAQQNYSAALTDYRQLLAKDQQNPKLNFCYGVCIFEVQQHFEAAKYFDVALGLKQIPDPLLYYYRARIYQEQYFFSQALSAYETYQKLTLDQKNKKDVSTQIAECKRALDEITTFQRLPLLAIATTQSQKFYESYPFDSEDYTFYEAPEAHSKNNAKHQYTPVYAYKRGMKYRILASYGAKGEQLDLYVQRKDANNNWGELLLIGGGVNSLLSDEAYGFYDPNSQVLYFSSTANSIGAYDLYKANYDLNSNLASDIEKMPYPYSSPTDDLFYVTDLTQQQAYFATARQGKVGQYEIYTLQLDQPAQTNFVFAGAFSNELEPNSKTMTLRFTNLATSEKYGPFVSDADGNYTVALPAKGEFQLELEIAGASQIYTTRFGIPQVPAGKALQQQIRYSSDEYGKEKWQVLNQLFDTDPEAQIANISKLQLNVARGNLLQTKQTLAATNNSEQTNLGAGWGLAPQDTAAFIATLTDTLLAAEVSLENQVRLMELLRQDFEKQLNSRERLFAELSALLTDPQGQTPNVAAQKAKVLASLKAVEAELAFAKRWIEINQAANIPDLVLLDTLQQINERNQALLLLGDTTTLINGWQQGQAAIAQYLQIAAFDGASAFETAQLEAQLRLQKMLKEESLVKEQQQQLTQQIKKLQTDIALQSKKDQVQTQQTIASLQRDLSQVEVLSQQLAEARQVLAEKAQVYDQAQLKARYLKEAENQALPKLNFETTYEELLAQYAQQESLSENLKLEVTSNPEVTSTTTENGNMSLNPSENGNLSSTNSENGNLSSTNQNNTSTNPEVSSNPQETSNPEVTSTTTENGNMSLNPSENGNLSSTNPSENGNVSTINSNNTSTNQEVSSNQEITSNPEVTSTTIENGNSSLNPTENGNVSTTNPTENGNGSNINDRIRDFEQQLETMTNLSEVNFDELPEVRRLGLSNEELLELDNDLTLPTARDISIERAGVTTLTTEAEVQGYVNYVSQRLAFEQTKEQLQQNQLAIRSLEEAYTPEVKEQLVQLLEGQEVLRAQLQRQKQMLIQVRDQELYETLLQENFRPQVSAIATTSTTSLGMPQTVAFQIQERPNTTTPLPVGLPCPEGLVFRVQVGAFRKPVSAERFREFTPVDGKVLANGLTVYMAGYFQSSAEALKQQNFIRTLGYADAFVVAYQNCTRLSLAQGRALEGRAPVANTTVAAQTSKFAGPGQGLYYSVQVGVYNRPITSEAQIGLTELIEAQTAKGQYRYASGKFDNLKAAKVRQQQAVAKGITDAFIVAYYQGKRIDLAQAKLLAQSGIAFESFQPSAAPQVISTAVQQQIAALQLPQVKSLQLPDPICRFELRCTDCQEALTRFNRVGVFVYDDQKEMIVSAMQKESQWSVVQLMYLKEMRKRSTNLKGATQTLVLEQSELDGGFVDWLLRQHNGYELFIDEQGQIQLRYLVPTEE